MISKITYGREEGGFSVYVNGVKKYAFRQKGWMNNLLESPDMKPCKGKIPGFLKTQFEYHGIWE